MYRSNTGRTESNTECTKSNTECTEVIQNAKTLIHKEVIDEKTEGMKKWKYWEIEPGLSSL
jgi:hypothetical protein